MALFFIACVIGCAIQYWRRLALNGFLPRSFRLPTMFTAGMIPPLLATFAGRFLSWLVSFSLKWGAAAILTADSGLAAGVAALTVGIIAARLVVNAISRQAILFAQQRVDEWGGIEKLQRDAATEDEWRKTVKG